MTPLPTRAPSLVVVLVQPEYSSNVGAAARAMGNLGLHHLRLVQGVALDADARAMACAFQDVLAGALTCTTLAEALADCVFAVAMVSPMRARECAPVELRALQPRIAEITQQGKVALVFGSEQSGLSHQDVARCNAVAGIALPSRRPTLNLAQAVLLAGYELLCVPPASIAPAPTVASAGEEPVTHGEVEAALRVVSAALTRLGYGDPVASPLPGRILDRCRAIANRARLTANDAQMLHGLLARLKQRLP